MTTKRTNRLRGTREKPRLSVYRSNQYIYAQIVDDIEGVTLVSASSIKYEAVQSNEAAVQVGQSIANEAKKQNITRVIFDRGRRQYKGKIKSLAEAARGNGLAF